MLSMQRQPRQRHEAVVHRVDRAVRGGGGRLGPERRSAAPKRTSLPSMLPAAWSIGSADEQRVAPRLAGVDDGEPGRRTGCPWRRRARGPGGGRRPCGRRGRRRRPGSAGSRRTAAGSRATVGFSSGCAELILKKPPPLVPSCLIATWLAAGPWAMSCSAPSSVWRGV